MLYRAAQGTVNDKVSAVHGRLLHDSVAVMCCIFVLLCCSCLKDYTCGVHREQCCGTEGGEAIEGDKQQLKLPASLCRPAQPTGHLHCSKRCQALGPSGPIHSPVGLHSSGKLMALCLCCTRPTKADVCKGNPLSCWTSLLR